MTRRLLALSFFTLATASAAHAQRLLVPYRNPPQVRLVDANAGALVEEVVYDLSTLPEPPITVRDAQLAGSFVFVSADELVHRFDAFTQTYLGAVDTGSTSPTGLTAAGGSVWVAGRNLLIELALDGTVLAQHPVEDAIDVFERGGELIVANNLGDSIDRYALDGTFLGSIVDGTTGGLLAPSSIAPRSNGNILAVNLPRVREYDMTGAQVAEYQIGAFEQGIQEMNDGRLFVTTSILTLLFDPGGQRATTTVGPLEGLQIGRVSPFDAGSGAYTRFCQGAPNSAGPGALFSALGFPRTSAGFGEMELAVTGLPPNALGLFVYGSGTTQVPYGDGLRCIPGAGGFRLPPTERASIFGRLDRNLDFAALPAAGAITPGSTWNFQFLYRDPAGSAGFNASDAVGVTFRQ